MYFVVTCLSPWERSGKSTHNPIRSSLFFACESIINLKAANLKWMHAISTWKLKTFPASPSSPLPSSQRETFILNLQPVSWVCYARLLCCAGNFFLSLAWRQEKKVAEKRRGNVNFLPCPQDSTSQLAIMTYFSFSFDLWTTYQWITERAGVVGEWKVIKSFVEKQAKIVKHFFSCAWWHWREGNMSEQKITIR